GNNARNGGKNSLNRLIRCVCGKKIGPDPRNFNQRVSLGRNDLLIRTFPNFASYYKNDIAPVKFSQLTLNFVPFVSGNIDYNKRIFDIYYKNAEILSGSGKGK
ncbi:hypothetical protein ACHH1U_21935, partial [Citrobacter freundii complex sp. 2024EL-00224]